MPFHDPYLMDIPSWYSGQPAPLISDDVYEIVMANKERLNSSIIYDRDFEYDYFGFKTLEKSYLLKINSKVCAPGRVIEILFSWSNALQRISWRVPLRTSYHRQWSGPSR